MYIVLCDDSLWLAFYLLAVARRFVGSLLPPFLKGGNETRTTGNASKTNDTVLIQLVWFGRISLKFSRVFFSFS
jgi:hypothetical protein